jgi:hypothetical protein
MTQQPVRPAPSAGPLPRRRHREHLSPHLRDPGEVATGTAFAAFDVDPADRRPDVAGAAAAQFRDGAQRGRARPPVTPG